MWNTTEYIKLIIDAIMLCKKMNIKVVNFLKYLKRIATILASISILENSANTFVGVKVGSPIYDNLLKVGWLKVLIKLSLSSQL